MNYYQYKRRAPNSRATDFIKPFLLIVILIGIIVAAWQLLGSALTGEGDTLSSEKIFLDIETGSAKAMTSGDSEWKNVPTGIYLYEDEKLKTQSDGRVTLRLFDKDTVRLDKSTELQFASLSRDAIGGQTTLELKDGKLWVMIDKSGAITSEFTVNTGLLSIKSSGGSFALSYPGMLYVITGSVKVDILHEGKIVKSSTIGVGQELIIDEVIAADLADGTQKEVIFGLDDAFKSSNWYRWNQQQDGPVVRDDETEGGDDIDVVDEDIPLDDDEGTSEATEDAAEEEEIDENDKEAPAIPQIEKPGSNGDTVGIDDIVEIITGSVSSDTEAVIVNDYRLTKYIPGSKTFEYTAKVLFKNLEVGDNEYKVIAVDKAGNKSEAATITLVLTQDVYDEAQPDEEEEEDTVDTTPAATATGGVKITAPNNGDNLATSETSFEIKGDVPAETAKVVVNGYTLQGFSEGSTTFLYRANSTLGTLEIGALNIYTAKAYDADDELLGSATITIDVESGVNGEGAPTITMPSSSGSYQTTLDQIVIGGTVGKWITRVRIDGANLDAYIPGSEEWKKTVTLSSGENSYNICAEKEGVEQGCSSITIDYQN